MRRSLHLVGLLIVILGACGGEEPLETHTGFLVTSSGSPVLALAAIEGGAPIAIGVSMDHAPLEPVVVELTADRVVALDRSALTFTPADYDRPQPVVITPADDADVIDGAGAITLAATDVDSLVLPIAIADDDRVWLVTQPEAVAVVEGGSTTFRIALGVDPGGPVTVTVTSSDAASATVQPATLTFAANWAVPQTVTVTAPADADDLDEAIAIELGGLHVTGVTVPADVLDAGRQNFMIAPDGLDLREGGADGSFTVRLTQPPVGTLAIAVSSLNPVIATVSRATLTFTAANYTAPQSVTVSPRSDIDGRLDTSTVLLRSSGLRDRFVALAVAEDAIVDAPDVSGDFLMTILPGFSDGPVIRYRVTYGIEPIEPRLFYSATALSVADGQPVGDPIVHNAEFHDGESFEGAFFGLLPLEANPYTEFPFPLGVEAGKLGHIVDADFLCGTLGGSLGNGLVKLDGTTWAAVRITGSGLPDPVVACP